MNAPTGDFQTGRPDTPAGHSIATEPRTGHKIRVLMAKAGLDGHDRGIKVVSRALRDAGMEVIYTGLHQTPEQVVRAAVDEDVDAVGLSLLSGAHMVLFPRILDLLREEGGGDILLFGGGTIPADDVNTLKGMGVSEVFTPGAPLATIVKWVREHVDREESETA